MVIYIIFTLLIISVLISIAFSLREKHKNIGFVITSSVLIVADILSMLIISADSIKEARNYILLYYLFYPWLFFGTMMTVIRSHTKRMYMDCHLGMASICFIQSVIIAVSFFRNGMISFDKVVFFGRIWWVAKMPMLQYSPDAYVAFHALCLINCITIFSIMSVFVYTIPKVFKVKYINLMILQGCMFVLILITFIYNLPVWIHTLVMNFICYITYYYVFLYSDIKLKESVLHDFANELSDGIIVYNMYNDVIFINDSFRKIVSEEIIKGIRNIDMMERFIARSETVGDFSVLPYSYNDKNFYFSADKKIVGNNDDIIGIVYIFHDMTAEIEQISLMEKINTDLERNSMIKSDYLSFMSAKLLVPLNKLLSLSESSLEDNSLSADLREKIEQIKLSGENLMGLVNEMHDHSMLENDNLELFNSKYNPITRIHDIAEIIQDSLPEGIDFIFIIDPELPHELEGDSLRMRQIIINLSNTMACFIGQGIIRIVLSCRPLTDSEICLEFHILGISTGAGISDKATDSDPGFDISKKLISAMNGSFDMNLSRERESYFRFSFDQKIIDDRKDLYVENSSRKYAYCLNETNMLNEEFAKEMKALRLDGKSITSLNDYKATGKTDYLFFISEYYNEALEKFLDEHPMVIGIMLTDSDKDIPVKKNLRCLSKPLTTLSMALVFNGMNYDVFEKQINEKDK